MKRDAPAALRNREPIREVLAGILPKTGLVLEIAAGTGQHAVHFAAAFPHLKWQASDPSSDALASIEAWRTDDGTANLLAPIRLDASAETWPIEACDAIVCINMIHISPIEATVGLFKGAQRVLASGAPLVTYGPYRVDGEHTAPSNVKFEQWLHSLDPRYGVRDIADLEAIATTCDLRLDARHPMPANNFTLVWRRT